MENRNLPVAALILAGGMGTRLRPITNTIPKPLVVVGNKPTIAHIIDEIVRNGINTIYVSVGYKSDRIIKYLNKYEGSAKITYIKETSPLGTGGAVKLALKKMGYSKSDIFMVYGDDLFTLNIGEMYKLHKKEHADITITIKMSKKNKDIKNSGVVGLHGNRVIKFVEKPELYDAPSNFINIGKYIMNVNVYKKFPRKRIFSFEKDFVQREIKKMSIYAYVSKGVWYPTDNIERLNTARKIWNKR